MAERANIEAYINRLPEVMGYSIKNKRIRIYVRKLTPEHLAVKEIMGYPVEFIEVGVLRALALRPMAELDRTARFRPIPGGVSVSALTRDLYAGTYGGPAYIYNDVMMLSNNHVFVPPGRWSDPPLGWPIIQPGTFDGGTREDIIATLRAAVPIKFGGAPNLVDAALAQPISPRLIKEYEILGIGEIFGARRVTYDDEGITVRMSGRTTPYAEGKILDIDATVQVVYDLEGRKVARFDHQILVTPAVAKPGDSGSLLVDRNNLVVGLIFAGSEKVAVANRIDHVLRAFSISFTPSGKDVWGPTSVTLGMIGLVGAVIQGVGRVGGEKVGQVG